MEPDQQDIHFEKENEQILISSFDEQCQDDLEKQNNRYILLSEITEVPKNFKESERVGIEMTNQHGIQIEVEEKTSDSYFEDQSQDELEILPLWFGEPNKDTLTAEDWIESVQVSNANCILRASFLTIAIKAPF